MFAKGLAALVFTAALTVSSFAEPVRISTSWPALVDAEGMRQRIETPRLRVIDLRAAEAYAEGHLDGAVSVPMEAWYEASQQDALSSLIGQAGVHPARPLVLVHDDTATGPFIEAAWLGWELRRRGVGSVTILSGGMAGWKAAGLRTTSRVHRHRVYDLPYEIGDLALSSQNEVAGIRLGVAEGELLEITGPGNTGYLIEGVPVLSMEELVGSGEIEPLDLLEDLKMSPVSWQSERVVVLSEDRRVAPAFWFLASEILGIRDIAVMPGGADDTSIAGLGQ